MYVVTVAVKRRKRGFFSFFFFSFFFLFLENKEDKEQWADLNSPSIFITKFAFLPPKTAGATLYTYLPLTLYSLEKTLMLGRIEGRRRRGWRRMRWLDGIIEHESEQTPGDSKGQGSLGFCSPWGHDWVTEQLCWIHPVSGVYHFNTLTLVVTYQKEGQRATELPDSLTGFLTLACDCL